MDLGWDGGVCGFVVIYLRILFIAATLCIEKYAASVFVTYYALFQEVSRGYINSKDRNLVLFAKSSYQHMYCTNPRS